MISTDPSLLTSIIALADPERYTASTDAGITSKDLLLSGGFIEFLGSGIHDREGER
jgi:hypothetical protein